MFTKIIFFLLPCLVLTACQTSRLSYPQDCQAENVRYSAHNVNLHINTAQQKSALFYLKNISDKPIYVDQVNPNPGASAGWITLISPRHYNLLRLKRSKFSLYCSQAGVEQVQAMSCQQVLKICRYLPSADKKLPSREGWIAENL